MLPHPTSTKTKQKEYVRDRKKLVSQIDIRNLKPLDDKITFSSPKYMNYAVSMTQKNSSSQKISFGITSPKNFYPHYRKNSEQPKNTFSRSETLKGFTNRIEPKTLKDQALLENVVKTDNTYRAFPYANPTASHPSTTKNLTLNPKKSFVTESSAIEIKNDVLEKGLSPKHEEKYKSVKQSEVIKQIEAQIQLHRRVKKPLQATKSVAVSNIKELSNLGNDSKVSEGPSHRRSNSTKDIPFNKLELPVKPNIVLERYSAHLAPHEKDEILKYPEIYYISDMGHKLPAKEEAECDDERGDYIVIRNDHINYRYEVLEMLGRGSFGQVVKVYDHKNKEQVALKIIRSPKKFHLQAKIEIKILKYMMQHQGADFNVLEIKDYFVFRKHVCLVSELMSLNLYDFLKKNKFKGFSLSVIRKFAIQILYALKFLNQHKIIHCDLKPENILLKQLNKTGVRLIDFGSSCFDTEKLYTYIQSRFYRSPEIILGLGYSTQIDMWSFGCLLCELYLGYPIFAGDSEYDQLLAMMEVLGPPQKELIMQSPKKGKFFDDDLQPKVVPNTKGKIRNPSTLSLETILNSEDESFVHLVKSCLEFDPSVRFSPVDALAHEWILKGLPPELKVQHMKLLEKTVPATTGRRESNINEKAKETEERGVELKTEKSAPESIKISKHKKTASGPIHRIDLARAFENIQTGAKTEVTRDEKNVVRSHMKGKSSLSIAPGVGIEETIANVTINLNESEAKLSSRASKRYSQSKQPSYGTMPHGSPIKDEKTANITNFYSQGSNQNISITLSKQSTLISPKRGQTNREGSEVIDSALSGGRSGGSMTNFSEIYFQKTPKKVFFQKSLSLEKRLISPKASESTIKVYNVEDSGSLSAPRKNGFPSLQSPTSKKKKE